MPFLDVPGEVAKELSDIARGTQRLRLTPSSRWTEWGQYPGHPAEISLQAGKALSA